MAVERTFRIDGPRIIDVDGDVWDLYEGRGFLGSGSEVFSCVALYKNDWQDGVAALGGTRWMKEADGHSQADAVEEAKALAHAMYFKNRLLKHAAEMLEARKGSAAGDLSSHYHWQGGKGVIWTPRGVDRLEPERLCLHGELLDALGGIYIGSKDQGVGTSELAEIARCSGNTIGLACGRDTGEATAVGVVAGLRTALARVDGTSGDDALRGRRILVCGLGKVGVPLVRFLRAAGVELSLYDPYYLENGVVTERSVRKQFLETVRRGAEVEPEDETILLDLLAAGRFLADEEEALTLPGLDAISPNGGNTEWLTSPLPGAPEGPTRGEIIAGQSDGRTKLVLGAANDQLTGAAAGGIAVLDRLAAAGWLFVPDPLVSPGGVIAVSHEPRRNGGRPWSRDAVNTDSREVVEVSVEHFFDRIEARHGSVADVSGEALWETFESLVHEPWSATE